MVIRGRSKTEDQPVLPSLKRCLEPGNRLSLKPMKKS